MRKTPLFSEWRSALAPGSCAGHWPPGKVTSGPIAPPRIAGSPDGSSLFLKAAHERLLCRVPGVDQARSAFPSSGPEHHWRSWSSNRRTVGKVLHLQSFTKPVNAICLDYGSEKAKILQKSIGGRRTIRSTLAVGTIMSAPAGNDDAADGRLATATWLTRALVNTVLKLKKTPRAIGIDVIGDRRAA